jgi:hypothetical protein
MSRIVPILPAIAGAWIVVLAIYIGFTESRRDSLLGGALLAFLIVGWLVAGRRRGTAP